MKRQIETEIELYRQLIEVVNVAVVAFDVKGNVLIWNKAAAALTGYSARDAMGPTHIIERLYPDASYRQNVLKTIGVAVRTSFKDIEWTLRTKSGERRCISWSGIPVQDKDGTVVGSFAVGIDVTRRNAVKERERESFRALLKAVRVHEHEKSRCEEEIASLKAEVNALCRELSRPPRFPVG